MVGGVKLMASRLGAKLSAMGLRTYFLLVFWVSLFIYGSWADNYRTQ